MVSGAQIDIDGDGRSNLEEYALGGDPRAVDFGGITEVAWVMGPTGPQLRLSYAKSGSDLTFAVQQSSSISVPAWNRDNMTAELYDAGRGLFYQAATVHPGDFAKFLRLQLIKP